MAKTLENLSKKFVVKKSKGTDDKGNDIIVSGFSCNVKSGVAEADIYAFGSAIEAILFHDVTGFELTEIDAIVDEPAPSL